MKLTQLNTTVHLEEVVLDDLRESLKELLSYIKNSGQLEKYWANIDQRNDLLRADAKKKLRERKKIEIGSAFNSDEEAPLKVFQAESENDSDYDSEEIDELESNYSAEDAHIDKKSNYAKSKRSRYSKHSKEN